MSFLYIVSTPIGNLGDITFRAVEVLKSVDLIAAEDTRHSRRLLDHYGIETKTLSLHEYNEKKRSEYLLDLLKQGKSIALISDAGTPLISDPGYALVKMVRDASFRVITIPGASAVIAALSVSGLPTDRFVFEGFLPAKGSIRQKKLEKLVSEARTLIFYESTHRILEFIELLETVFGSDREMVIARELTKNYETIYSGSITRVKTWLKNDEKQQKGEFVVLLKGAEEKEVNKTEEQTKLLKILLPEVSLKRAVDMVVTLTKSARNEVYDLALKIKNEKENSP